MSGFEGKTYYELLGVSKTATTEQIKQAYKDIAQAYHPDSNFYSEIVAVEVNPAQEEAFKLITSAYTTLINTERRARYDQTLAPDLKGWTETELRVPKEEWALSTQDGENRVPYAWGQFGKVEAASSSSIEAAMSEVRPMSEILYPKRESWFTRLCWFFGL